MNVLYQSERLNQFKINDLHQQAIHAEQIRMARGTERTDVGAVVLRFGQMLRSLAHLSPRIRLDTRVTIGRSTPADAVCLPGMDC